MPSKQKITVPNRDCEFWDLTTISKNEDYAVPPSQEVEVVNPITSGTSPAVGTQNTLTHSGFSYAASKLTLATPPATLALAQKGQLRGTTKGLTLYTPSVILADIAPLGIGGESIYPIRMPGYLGTDLVGTTRWRTTTSYGTKAYLTVGTTATDISGVPNSTIVTQFPTAFGAGTFYTGTYATLDTSPGNTTAYTRYGGSYSLNFTTTDWCTLAIWIEANQGSSRSLSIKLQTQAGVDITTAQVFNQQFAPSYWALWDVNGPLRISITSAGDNPLVRAILLS